MKKDVKAEKPLKRAHSRSIVETFPEPSPSKDYKKLCKELAARANYAELELAKVQLEQESYNTIKRKLKEEISLLKSQHENDELKIKELNYTISQLNKSLNEVQSSSTETTKNQQKTLEKLKGTLSDVESVVSYRATTSKRYLSKISRVINSYAQSQTDGSIQFKRFLKEVNSCVEELGKIVSNNGTGKTEGSIGNFNETLREKEQTIEEYRKILEKMREQMQMLRERIRELEGQSQRKSPDQEKRIKVLMQEKESLTKHVQNLEESLQEQSVFMASVKEAISSGKGRNSPDIDEEIAIVDQEIMELQCSLERALS